MVETCPNAPAETSCFLAGIKEREKERGNIIEMKIDKIILLFARKEEKKNTNFRQKKGNSEEKLRRQRKKKNEDN